MKLFNKILKPFLILFMLSAFSQPLAQRVYTPLTIQGLDHFQTFGARTNSMGGASVAAGNDVIDMFTNPALLLNIDGISIKAGAKYSSNEYEQVQDWTPNKLYAELSLIFRNEDLYKTKPFDNIKPDWNKTLSKATPGAFAASARFKLNDINFNIALGYGQVIDLNHFYQNNNALNPNIGQMRPAPIPRLVKGDSLKVGWFQNYNKREGAIYGITPALSVNILENLSAGVSSTFLKGSSDDNEYINNRGLFTLRYNNDFTLEPVNYVLDNSWTSDYKGTMLNFGLFYKDEKFSVAATVKPSFTITRTWTQVLIPTAQNTAKSSGPEASEEIKIPALYTIGFAIYPTNNITIGIDYEIKNLDKTEYKNLSDSTYTPWLGGNVLKLGAEYRVLKNYFLRLGYREQMETFEAEGTAILDEPVSGKVYSLGLGAKYSRLQFDFSCVYSTLNYEDTWLSNNNTNKTSRLVFMLEAGYNF